MKSLQHVRRLQILAAIFILGGLTASPADLPAVRVRGGSMHGFLVVRSATGALLGSGDFIQTVHSERTQLDIVLHFRDGSLHRETTVFNQGPSLRLVSDHLVQHGPFFTKPVDMLVRADGTVFSLASDGRAESPPTHLDLPADIANGLLPAILINTSPGTSPQRLPYVVAYGKGRLVHLLVSAGQQATFTVAGLRHSATVFLLHPELGGVAGVVAPIVGRQPDDLHFWVIPGQSPMLVREVGQISEGGPVVSIEIAGATFPHAESRN